jgi:hypothetical protein
MTKFTAIDPAGKFHTRTSKTRIYTHTVVALPSSVKHTLSASSRQMKQLHRGNYQYHTSYADGTSPYLMRQQWESDAAYAGRYAEEVQKSVAELNGCNTVEDYVTMKIEAAHEAIRHAMARGYYETYQNMGWCGRRDLATALATKTSGHGMVSVTILDAN